MCAFFNGDVLIRIETINRPGPVSPSIGPRTIQRHREDIVDGRVCAGMHFRHSCLKGAQFGRKVARSLVSNFFRRTSVVGRHQRPSAHVDAAR